MMSAKMSIGSTIPVEDLLSRIEAHIDIEMIEMVLMPAFDMPVMIAATKINIHCTPVNV